MSQARTLISENHEKRHSTEAIEVSYDIVFVINSGSRGWILDKICHVIAEASGVHCFFLYSERNNKLTVPLPRSRAYFFSHFSMMYHAMQNLEAIFNGAVFTWLTHFDKQKIDSLEELCFALNHADQTFCSNTTLEHAMVSVGVDPDRICTTLGGADPSLFQPHRRKGKTVGIVSAWYERKQPDKMFELVRSTPDIEYLLLAPGPEDTENYGLLWSNWWRFDQLLELPNLTYKEAAYEEYPSYFAEMDVYLSTSQLEGGPIPVIEAMMANVIPVATRTGFADDVLVGPLSEYIVDAGASIEQFETAVRAALKDRSTDVRKMAESLTWDAFGRSIYSKMAQHMAPSNSAPTVKRSEIVEISLDQTGAAMLFDGWLDVWEDGALGHQEPATVKFNFPKDISGVGRIVAFVASATKAPASLSFELNGNVMANACEVGAQPSSIMLLSPWIESDASEGDRVIELQFKAEKGSFLVSQLQFDLLEEADVGEILSFRKHSDCSKLLMGSWHNCEAIGTWSDGAVGQLSFTLRPSEVARNVRAKMILRVFGSNLPGGDRLRIAIVFGNSQHTEEFQVEDDEFGTYFLGPFSMETEAHTPVNISIERDISAAPSQISDTSNDGRQLGILLQSVVMEPYD